MKYFLILLVIVGFSGTAFAMPPFDSQEIFDFSDTIAVGKVIYVNSTFSPTHNLYHIQVEKFLKNPHDSEIIFAAGQNITSSRSGTQIFHVGDRALFFLTNPSVGYDKYSDILSVHPTTQFIEPVWDKCNIFEKDIPRKHWFLGGIGTTPKIQQGANRDIENFNQGNPITVTYDVSNISESIQEFDLDGTISISNGTAFEVRAVMNKHIILEPCTAYKTIDWRVVPEMSGQYNFEIKDSRSGNYGIGFVVGDGPTMIDPPLKQIQSGLESKYVVCKPGLELVMKKSNNQPVCIKETSVKSLTLRDYIQEYNGMEGEIPSDMMIIGIPHSLPVESK